MASTDPSLTAASLPEESDSLGSMSTPQHITMKEPAFSPSKRRTAQEQKKEKKEKKKKHKWTWRNLGRFWERRREDGSKKYAAL